MKSGVSRSVCGRVCRHIVEFSRAVSSDSAVSHGLARSHDRFIIEIKECVRFRRGMKSLNIPSWTS